MIAYCGHGAVSEVGVSDRGRQSMPSDIDLHSVCLSRGQFSRFHGQQSLEVLTNHKIVLAASPTPSSWQSSSSSSLSSCPTVGTGRRYNASQSPSPRSSSSSCSSLVDNHAVRYRETVSVCSSNPFVISIPTLSKLPPSLGCPISPAIIVTNNTKIFTFFLFLNYYPTSMGMGIVSIYQVVVVLQTQRI